MSTRVELDQDSIINADHHSALPHIEPLEDSTEPSIIYIEGLLRVFGAGIATYAGDESLSHGVARFESELSEYKPHATELVERWEAIYRVTLFKMHWNAVQWQTYVGEHIAIAEPLIGMELLPCLEQDYPLGIHMINPHPSSMRITSDFFGGIGYVPVRNQKRHVFTPIQARQY